MKHAIFYRCKNGPFVTQWYSYKSQAREEAAEHGWPKSNTITESLRINNPMIALRNLLNGH